MKIQVEVENGQGHQKVLTVSIPKENLDQKLNDKLNEYKKKSELKGYRKGKAPLWMVKNLYGHEAHVKSIDDLINESLPLALKEKELKPIEQPQIDLKNMDSEKDLTYTASFESYPPIELKKYSGIGLKKEEIKCTEEDVNQSLANIQKNFAEYIDDLLSVAVTDQSFVELEFQNLIEAGSQKNKGTFSLQGPDLLPQIKKDLIGMKSGEEKTIAFQTEEKHGDHSHHHDHKVWVKILGIKKQKLPELDEAFLQKLGGQFKTIEELKEQLKKEVTNQKTQEQLAFNRQKTADFLVKENPVEAPKILFDQQLSQLSMDFARRMAQAGLPQEQIGQKLDEQKEDLEKTASAQVKTSLILGAISERENIQVGDEELRKEISMIALQSQKKPQEVYNELVEKNSLHGLVQQMTELKALNWIMERDLNKDS